MCRMCPKPSRGHRHNRAQTGNLIGSSAQPERKWRILERDRLCSLLKRKGWCSMFPCLSAADNTALGLILLIALLPVLSVVAQQLVCLVCFAHAWGCDNDVFPVILFPVTLFVRYKKLLHFVIHICMKNFKKERHSVRNKHSRFMFSPIVGTHGILRFVPTMVLSMGGCFVCNFK